MKINREYIPFRTDISGKKPNTLRNTSISCPFCDTETLLLSNDLIEKDGAKILIKNLYPVMEHTYPIVYIENDTCNYDLSNYPKDMLVDVVRYGLTKWLELRNSDEFSNVIFFKNHGPYSGGSIKHPHMQIIGFYQNEPELNFPFDSLDGSVIWENDDFQSSVSHFPFTEGIEFTLRMKDVKTHLVRFSESLQNLTHYILNTLNPIYKSYNLFFYHHRDEIICKIAIRKPTSPLLLGYSLAQVPNNLGELANQIQSSYTIS